MVKKIISLVFIGVVFICFLTGCNKNSDKDTNSAKISVYEKIMDAGVIKIGIVNDTKPMTYHDENGNLTGFEIELANELTRRLSDKIKPKFVNLTSATRIEAVNSGEVDLIIATMTITDFRKISVNFSEPYFIAAQIVMIPTDSPVSSLKDLNNKRVGVITGTTAEKSLRHFVPKAVPSRKTSFAESTEDIINGKTAALIQDDVIIKGFISDNEAFKIFPQKLTVEPYGIAFKKSETDLKNHVDVILSDMKSDGTISKLKQKYGLD